MMKILRVVIVTVFVTPTFANAAFDGSQYESIRRLKNILGGKSLQCVPADHHKPFKEAYRGDDGYFTVSVNSKNEVKISDAGDSGYGFSNGLLQDIATTNQKVFLSVGDDGYQTLAIDFDRIGADSALPENCAFAALLDYSEFDYDGSTALACCLKYQHND